MDGSHYCADSGISGRWARAKHVRASACKIAAIEGHWENRLGVATPLILFGIPDMEQERTKFALEVPLPWQPDPDSQSEPTDPRAKSFPPADRPNSTVVFWSFRIMVGLGLLMITQGILSLWLRYKKNCTPLDRSSGSSC